MADLDPVLARRSLIARWVGVGKRVGYGLYTLACALFIAGYAGGYTSTITSVIVVSLVIGSIILAPAIVFGYGVKAAARDERRRGLTDSSH